ncbi:MAG: virulence factor [Alphaproteobacteria bacterium]
MAMLTVVYWRDIPAQVIARAGRQSAKRILPLRFETAIDRAAMRAGLRDSDSYLGEWRRGEATPCGDDLEAAASAKADEIELAYDDDRVHRLVLNGGKEQG